MTVAQDINATYTLPHNSKEAERLTKQHYIWKSLTGGSNFLTPLPESKEKISILDCGTGTGIWALDALKEARELGYQNIDAVGIDMTDEKFPSRSDLAQTLKTFELPDRSVSLELLIHNLMNDPPASLQGRFDIVNVRLVLIWIHTKYWPKIIESLQKCLKPGGYLQDQETAFELDEDCKTRLPMTSSAVRYCVSHFYHAGNDGPRLAEWHRAKSSLPDLLRQKNWSESRVTKYAMPCGRLQDPAQNEVARFTRDNMLLITRLGAKSRCFGRGLFKNGSHAAEGELYDDDDDDTLKQPYSRIPRDSSEVEKLYLLLQRELDEQGTSTSTTIVTSRSPL